MILMVSKSEDEEENFDDEDLEEDFESDESDIDD